MLSISYQDIHTGCDGIGRSTFRKWEFIHVSVWDLMLERDTVLFHPVATNGVPGGGGGTVQAPEQR